MTWEIIQGDCLEVMRGFADNHFDSCVCDPPYELGFMGKQWDATGIAYDVEMWREVLRVLKPGAHMLAFGGARTYHRAACAIEDAGFEIRDCIVWLYGQGFPKSHNVAGSIDKSMGQGNRGRAIPTASTYQACDVEQKHKLTSNAVPPYKARTDVAGPWVGWGTGLKPAMEPIVVARKPLSEKTVAANVLKWRTGALNIDGCRIKTGDDTTTRHSSSSYMTREIGVVQPKQEPYVTGSNLGRWPANVILDEEAGRMLDEQSGESKSRPSGYDFRPSSDDNPSHVVTNIKSGVHFDDSGGASRFFYCAKASRAEREAGLDALPEKLYARSGGAQGAQSRGEDAYLQDDSIRLNNHPTVKPVALMAYLCRLVTPPGGTVLDPFADSGSTGMAAIREGFAFVGIEKEAAYCEIARKRLAEAETGSVEMGGGAVQEVLFGDGQ